MEEAAKDGIVDELLNHGSVVFGEVAKSQWGSYCIQHSESFLCCVCLVLNGHIEVLEHGSAKHRNLALEHLISGLLEYATSEQGAKSVTKALKEGGKDTLDRIIKRMCEPAKGYVTRFHNACCSDIRTPSGRRAMIVDLALSVTGSQLIASVLPNVCILMVSR